jgi:hypothetical protein
MPVTLRSPSTRSAAVRPNPDTLSSLHALGFSHSSRANLVQETKRSLEQVVARALKQEREEAGFSIAAQDVGTIAAGGVVMIETRADGQILIHHLSHNPTWIEQSVVIGVNPDGARHESPALLHTLVKHKQASVYIHELNKVARQAANAVGSNDLLALANAVNHARDSFCDWSCGASIHPDTEELILQIQSKLGRSLLGWKSPGAGGACAVMILTTDREATIEQIHACGWSTLPTKITHGLSVEPGDSEGELLVSAGYRIDFVGGSDLGQAPEIAVDGLCVSAAIEPRLVVPVFV